MTQDSVREAFEAQDIRDYKRHKNSPGTYADGETRVAWILWQRCWDACNTDSVALVRELVEALEKCRDYQIGDEVDKIAVPAITRATEFLAKETK